MSKLLSQRNSANTSKTARARSSSEGRLEATLVCRGRPRAKQATDTTLLQATARDARARIERDLKTAPDRIWLLLAHILTHLFDPNLNVNTLKLACGVQTRAVLVQFHTALGESPRTYIESRRMETARVLLVTSRLPVWKIAKLLGFSTMKTFRRAFHRRQGESPRTYRSRRQRSAERPGAWRNRELRLAFAGELKAPRAVALLRELRQLYPTATRYTAGGEVAP